MSAGQLIWLCGSELLVPSDVTTVVGCVNWTAVALVGDGQWSGLLCSLPRWLFPRQAAVSASARRLRPDQGRATATISSRFGCMELSCHHQRTLSPVLQCCHFQHWSLGRYRAPVQLESWDIHPIARLNYATICNSAAWSLQFLQKPAANLDAQAVSPVAITRSLASRETTPSAASLFVCVHCLRKICASSG